MLDVWKTPGGMQGAACQWLRQCSSSPDSCLCFTAAFCRNESLCASSIPDSAYWESLIKFEIDKIAKISVEWFFPSDSPHFASYPFLRGKNRTFQHHSLAIGRRLWIEAVNQGVWGLFTYLQFGVSSSPFLILKSTYLLCFKLMFLFHCISFVCGRIHIHLAFLE